MPEIGAALIIGHYLGAVIVGILMRFYGPGEPESPPQAKGAPQASWVTLGGQSTSWTGPAS